MKEQLINKFMEKILQYANNAEIFLGKEIPIYVKEILEFNFYKEICFVAFLFIVLFFSSMSVRYGIKLVDDSNETKDETLENMGIMFFIVGCITAFVTIVVIASSGYTSIENIIKIKTAPRVFIIDYIRDKK